MDTETREVIVPLVHLNGSGAANLTEQYETAMAATRAALAAVEACAPNARDYYPLKEGAFEQARREHRERLVALHAIVEDLSTIVYGIEDQRNPR